MGVDEAFEAELAAKRAVDAARDAQAWARYHPFTVLVDGRMFCDACMRAYDATVLAHLPGGRCPGCGLTAEDIRAAALVVTAPTAKTLTSEG